MNVTVAPLAGGGGGDGAVEEEEHAARQKPSTNAVNSRIMIRSFLRRKPRFQLTLYAPWRLQDRTSSNLAASALKPTVTFRIVSSGVPSIERPETVYALECENTGLQGEYPENVQEMTVLRPDGLCGLCDLGSTFHLRPGWASSASTCSRNCSFLESSRNLPARRIDPLPRQRRVAATNSNVEQRSPTAGSATNLFYRLNVIRLKIPPLRERANTTAT